MNCPELSEEEFDEVYDYVDRIPLSRPRKNINRDFSDGALILDILETQIPGITQGIELQASNNVTIKQNNWGTLNQRVFKKINFQVSKMDIDHIITETPGAIERVLKQMKTKLYGFIRKKDEPNKDVVQLKRIAQNPRVRERVEELDYEIMELKQVVECLESKLSMMGQLIEVKDRKIETLASRLELANLL